VPIQIISIFSSLSPIKTGSKNSIDIMPGKLICERNGFQIFSEMIGIPRQVAQFGYSLRDIWHRTGSQESDNALRVHHLSGQEKGRIEGVR
jgi:hypothetical protein